MSTDKIIFKVSMQIEVEKEKDVETLIRIIKILKEQFKCGIISIIPNKIYNIVVLDAMLCDITNQEG